MNNFFLIAKIVSAFGKEGYLRINSYSDFPERFFDLKNIYIDFFGDKKEFTIDYVKKHKNFLTLKFKNFDSESDVSILVGKEIFVDEENLIKLPKDHFFVHDLIGSKIFRNNLEFGKIVDVLKYPANDVYVIELVNGGEILLPAIKEIVESFDPNNKIMVLKPGEEFYDDDEN